MPATLRGCLGASSLLAVGRRCSSRPHPPLLVDKPLRLVGLRSLGLLSPPRYTAVALLTSLLQELVHLGACRARRRRVAYPVGQA